jgi:hypothetical protein
LIPPQFLATLPTGTQGFTTSAPEPGSLLLWLAAAGCVARRFRSPRARACTSVVSGLTRR